MKQVHVGTGAVLMLLLCSLFGPAQQTVATAANAIVERHVDYRVGIFPNPVRLGNEPVGKPSKAHVITIGNPSGTPFGITGITAAGANPGHFAVANTCPASLAPGATCQITVTFTPAAAGKRSARI